MSEAGDALRKLQEADKLPSDEETWASYGGNWYTKKTCQRKAPLGRYKALREAKRLTAKNGPGGKPVRAYYCRHCGLWHVERQRQ